jgi:hypothetical protein
MILYTRRARARAAAPALARLTEWATLAARRLVRLAVAGHGHSPAAAWLTSLLGRLGAALRQVRAWVQNGGAL